MSLDQLKKEVQDFIKESYELTKNFNEKQIDFKNKVDEGMLGSKQANEELDNDTENINAYLRDKSTKLNEKLETIKEKELQVIEETSESITADTLAELSLLEKLNLTSEDINKHISKYKRSPLALRRLEEIAQDQKVFTQFPPTRETYLNSILGRINTNINNFNILRKNEHDVKTKMIVEGAINSIEEDITAYKTL